MPQLPLTLEVGAMWHIITLNPGSSLPYILELVLTLVGVGEIQAILDSGAFSIQEAQSQIPLQLTPQL